MNNPLNSLPESIRRYCVFCSAPILGTTKEWTLGNTPSFAGSDPFIWSRKNRGNGIAGTGLGGVLRYGSNNDYVAAGAFTIFVHAFGERNPARYFDYTSIFLSKFLVTGGGSHWYFGNYNYGGSEGKIILVKTAAGGGYIYVEGTPSWETGVHSFCIGRDATVNCRTSVDGVPKTPVVFSPENISLNNTFEPMAFCGDSTLNYHAQPRPVYVAALFNAYLTHSDHATLHAWATSLKSPSKVWPGYGGGKLYRPPTVRPLEPNCVGAWDFGDFDGQSVPDRSGGGRPMSYATSSSYGKSGVVKTNTPIGSGVRLGADPLERYCAIGSFEFAYQVISGKTKLTIVGVAYPGPTGFFIGRGQTAFLYGVQCATTYVRALASGDGANFYGQVAKTFGVDDMVHFVSTWDAGGATNADKLRLWLNGEEVALTYTGPPPSALGSSGGSAAATFLCGYHQGSGAYFPSSRFVQTRLYDTVWTPAQAQADYRKFAGICDLESDLSTALVSLGSEGGSEGARLSNTEWKFAEATTQWKVVDAAAAGGRSIYSVSNSGAGYTIYTESAYAYGTWEFDFRTPAAFMLSFMSGVKGGAGSGDYRLTWSGGQLSFQRVGVATYLQSAAGYFALDTWYRMRITRTLSGVWTVYVKGGAFDTWTLVDSSVTGSNPFTENTVKTSAYACLHAYAGSELANFRHYHGVLTP